MNNPQLYGIIIGILTAISCVLPGTFLILRGIALVSDAISHAVLPGIVIMFLYCGTLDSPLLLLGATLAGILTVVATELIITTKRLKKDAAISLVFPFFFSIGVLLISLYARTIHLDMDMVLLGELAFTPFNLLILNGTHYGPYALWTTTVIVIVHCVIIYFLYKELVLTTFDQTLARILRFSPLTIYYLLITSTSITAVNALHTVGSTAVVALMIAPPATAYVITKQVKPLLWLSVLFGGTCALSGYAIATLMNVSIAGSIALMCGLLFVIVIVAAPERGIYARFLYRQKEQEMAYVDILCAQYKSVHETHTLEDLALRLNWSLAITQKQIHRAVTLNYLIYSESGYGITSLGYSAAQKV